jgi:hypothetical protein
MKKQKPDHLETDCIWLTLKKALQESQIQNLKDFVGKKIFDLRELNGSNPMMIKVPKSHARMVRVRLDNWKVGWSNAQT